MSEVIHLPNASFEQPPTTYVNINIESWARASKPDWYVENGGFMWSQLVGAFKNPDPGVSDHIDNCDGHQAVWLFAVPEVALFQDYDSIGGTNAGPTHEFDACFEVGKSYRLAAGVIGGGGGMLPGVTLELGLYYRDAASNAVAVVTTSITNSLSVFSDNTHFVDFQANLPEVKAGDAWAGRHIGVRVLSTVNADLQGGYWDVDNVRLESYMTPKLANPVRTNDQFQFTLRSERGLVFDILASSSATRQLTNWMLLQTVTNASGSLVITDRSAGPDNRFYSVRQLP